MSRLLREAEFFSLTDEGWDEFVEASAKAGGFALSGRLVEANHGAGIWISPLNIQGLELMIPWPYVRSVVTAKDPESPKMFGLMNELARGPAPSSAKLIGPNETP
jgi:hypothetical protein